MAGAEGGGRAHYRMVCTDNGKLDYVRVEWQLTSLGRSSLRLPFDSHAHLPTSACCSTQRAADCTMASLPGNDQFTRTHLCLLHTLCRMLPLVTLCTKCTLCYECAVPAAHVLCLNPGPPRPDTVSVTEAPWPGTKQLMEGPRQLTVRHQAHHGED